MDKILQALKDVTDVLPVVDKLKVAFGDKVDFQRVLGLIYSDLLEFFQRVYKFFRRRAWHFYFAFDWGLFEHRFKSILDRLASHCDLLDREAAATHYSEMRKMRDARQLEDDESEQRRHNDMTQKVFAWLSAAEDSQEDYLHHIADIRQPRTCNWILEQDQVYSWIEDEKGDAVLWITAIPGAGKTFLASLLVEHLQSRKEQTVLYYFCGQKSSQDACASILRTLAIQLLRQNLDMGPLIHQAHFQKGFNRSGQGIKKMLTEILSNIKSTRIVLDGIDECDCSLQRELLGSLLDLQKHTGDSCKILMFSRHEPQINKALVKKTHVTLEGKTTEALRLYVRNSVEDLKSSFPGLEPTLFTRIEIRLEEMAKGMFLWVRLVTVMLQQQSSELDFEEAIEKLPDGLDQAYGRILSRFRTLSPLLKERASKILFWLCASYRPIEVNEVADGIAIRPGQTALNKRTRTQDMDRDILEVCAPLIEKSAGGVLDLVHFSAKEYLLDMQSGPFVDIAQAHFHIAFSCVTNLTTASKIIPRFSNGATQVEIENMVIQGSYGLQLYGHNHWDEHVLAYLRKVSSIDEQSMTLIDALRALCIIRKDQSNKDSIDSISRSPFEADDGLQKLVRFPSPHILISSWLNFKKGLEKMKPTFESLDAQEQWQLQKDETFLSLINYHLREITERLLTMDPSRLPNHIRQDDFTKFISRYGFRCRFYNCTHCFNSVRDRGFHEGSHIPSFPCLKCDFTGRGFRSYRDLDKQVKRYHMSAEDFEIPTSLDVTVDDTHIGDSSSLRSSGNLTRMLQRWNERGRNVLQQSFRQVLSRLELSEASTIYENNSASSTDLNKTTGLAAENVSERPTHSIGVDDIREKIDGDHYQTLKEFKDDIRKVSNDRKVKAFSDKTQETYTWDQEIEKVLIGYPDFANFDSKSIAFAGQITTTGLDNPFHTRNAAEMDYEYLETTDPAAVSFPASRTPYWSIAEEKEFPKLLQHYGRDYVKISDYLKTKTVDEVELHFLHLLSTEREDLKGIAEADAPRSLLELNSDEKDVGDPPLMTSSTEHAGESAYSGADVSLGRQERMLPQYIPTGALPRVEDRFFQNAATASKHKYPMSLAGMDNRPTKKKRGPARRELCPHCNKHPEGIHENAFKKHTERYHEPTRKVWICKDVSIDKNFLASCSTCSSNKRYRFKRVAFAHLRQFHFQSETPAETLLRWIAETKELNPQYKEGTSDIPVEENDSARLPSLKSVMEQKPSGKLNLNGISESPTSPFYLQSEPSTPSHGSEFSDGDSNQPDAQQAADQTKTTNPLDKLLLRDVSFDQVNPSFAGVPQTTDVQGNLLLPPMTTSAAHKAFIRTEQVNGLPHLSSYEKVVCQDQVEALSWVIENDVSTSRRYTASLNLESLSQRLLKDLRDWRRINTLAPHIPISL